ncbi:GNAT family N-acetyltransferase [Phenylobacterium sp.]|uniref:GNAT family N-acetyltransferase n=1 Tax=Phenylobacterium sp. TaxID=1871053 RepID=UPI00289B3DF0|nr:GNAT family N-acetyltransferase [Phenylobacterium sp.]
MSHPLDRPVWSALAGRQSALRLQHGAAVRFSPEYGLFAAAPDASAASLADLAALVRAHGDVALVEPDEPPPIEGLAVRSRALCWQMVAETPNPVGEPAFDFAPLSEEDAPRMLELARLTAPGPFFERTHELGRFVGVKVAGQLVAMAGERMQPPGFTEVSGVCTHPDHRGRGYAAGLMLVVAARIRARGEVPFLHSYAHNTGAIALYQALGFEFRRELVMTTLTHR